VSGLDGDVLVLLARTTQAMSGRDIAERLGLRSHDGVRKSLQRLASQGIVVREGSRNAHLHQLNREHLGAAAVLALAEMRSHLWARIRDAIAGWEISPVHASAFGSAARGDGDDESDIDLLVVRPTRTPEIDATWVEQVEGLRDGIEAWTGNRASIIELADDEIAALLTRPQDQPVLHAVLREGIDLAGVPARRLLGELRAS
jgi:biotin operon repressor